MTSSSRRGAPPTPCAHRSIPVPSAACYMLINMCNEFNMCTPAAVHGSMHVKACTRDHPFARGNEYEYIMSHMPMSMHKYMHTHECVHINMYENRHMCTAHINMYMCLGIHRWRPAYVLYHVNISKHLNTGPKTQLTMFFPLVLNLNLIARPS